PSNPTCHSQFYFSTFVDDFCIRMSIYCTPDDLDLERGNTLAKYAYESRAGKPAPAFAKAQFQSVDGEVLETYSAIELNEGHDEPAPEPEPSKKRRSKKDD